MWREGLCTDDTGCPWLKEYNLLFSLFRKHEITDSASLHVWGATEVWKEMQHEQTVESMLSKLDHMGFASIHGSLTSDYPDLLSSH